MHDHEHVLHDVLAVRVTHAHALEREPEELPFTRDDLGESRHFGRRLHEMVLSGGRRTAEDHIHVLVSSSKPRGLQKNCNPMRRELTKPIRSCVKSGFPAASSSW